MPHFLLVDDESGVRDLAVIVLTAQGSVDVAVEAMKLGAFDFVQEPVSELQELRLLAARAARAARSRGTNKRVGADEPACAERHHLADKSVGAV